MVHEVVGGGLLGPDQESGQAGAEPQECSDTPPDIRPQGTPKAVGIGKALERPSSDPNGAEADPEAQEMERSEQPAEHGRCSESSWRTTERDLVLGYDRVGDDVVVSHRRAGVDKAFKIVRVVVSLLDVRARVGLQGLLSADTVPSQARAIIASPLGTGSLLNAADWCVR